MAHLVVRKTLRKMGVLNQVKSIKKKFVHKENAFKPADPRLLLSMTACLDWLRGNDLLEGRDYMEFGIFRGFNLWYVQAQMRSWGIRDADFYGYDSFFGIPPVEGVDAGGAFHEGDFYAGIDEVRSFFNRFGVEWDRTFLVEGFFSESLTPENFSRHNGRKFSLCVVDCDLYSSAKEVLTYIEPLIGEKSMIWFDDWDDYAGNNEKGERRAFREFMDEHPDLAAEPFPVEGGSGLGFIMSRK